MQERFTTATEIATAVGTIGLALVAGLTSIISANQRRDDIRKREAERKHAESREKISALHRMAEILSMYQTQLQPLLSNEGDAASIEYRLRDLQVALNAALSDTISRGLPAELYSQVISALFVAHRSFATIAGLQRRQSPVPAQKAIENEIVVTRKHLANAVSAVNATLEAIEN